MSLTLRLTKGSPLTNLEMDNNLEYLDNNKLSIDGSTPITGTQSIHELNITKSNSTLGLPPGSGITLGAANNTINIPGTLNANAATSGRWLNARTITLTGAASGSVAIDGSSNVSLAVSAVSAVQLANTRNFSLTGSIQGAAVSFNGTDNVQLTTTIGSEVITPSNLDLTAEYNFNNLQLNGQSVSTTQNFYTPNILDETDLTGTDLIIEKTHTNRIAVDVAEATTAFELGVSNAWTTSEIGEFRLDLKVNTGQTITIDNTITGQGDIIIPASGTIVLLFDKPYGTTTWKVNEG